MIKMSIQTYNKVPVASRFVKPHVEFSSTLIGTPHVLWRVLPLLRRVAAMPDMAVASAISPRLLVKSLNIKFAIWLGYRRGFS